MNTYFDEDEVEALEIPDDTSTSNDELTAKEGGYKIKLSEIYNGSINKSTTLTPLTTDEMENAKGNFVKYNVTYTDAYYTDYNYTESNGWRILNIKNDGTGKYDVKIISTGIPARLHYHYNRNETAETNVNSNWWGTYTDVKNYYIDDNIGSDAFKTSTEYSSNYSAYYISYGLHHNFAKITFTKGISSNLDYSIAYYDTLDSQNGSLDTEAKVLTAFTDKKFSGKITGIRNVEVSDIKSGIDKSFSGKGESVTEAEDRMSTGLFVLQNIKNNGTKHGVNTYTYPDIMDKGYWLSFPQENSDDEVRTVLYGA